jgi:hypothetical protein
LSERVGDEVSAKADGQISGTCLGIVCGLFLAEEPVPCVALDARGSCPIEGHDIVQLALAVRVGAEQRVAMARTDDLRLRGVRNSVRRGTVSPAAARKWTMQQND